MHEINTNPSGYKCVIVPFKRREEWYCSPPKGTNDGLRRSRSHHWFIQDRMDILIIKMVGILITFDDFLMDSLKITGWNPLISKENNISHAYIIQSFYPLGLENHFFPLKDVEMPQLYFKLYFKLYQKLSASQDRIIQSIYVFWI